MSENHKFDEIIDKHMRQKYPEFFENEEVRKNNSHLTPELIKEMWPETPEDLEFYKKCGEAKRFTVEEIKEIRNKKIQRLENKINKDNKNN